MSFYAGQMVSRGGPLHIVWLAAHVDGNLKRQQVFDASIPLAIDTILSQAPVTSGGGSDEPPLALRLSGQLLLGVVRVYSRKVTYLQQDCDEALQKMAPTIAPTIEESAADRETIGSQGGPGTSAAVGAANVRKSKRALAAVAASVASGRNGGPHVGASDEEAGSGSNDRNNNNEAGGGDVLMAGHQWPLDDDEIFGGGGRGNVPSTSGKGKAAGGLGVDGVGLFEPGTPTLILNPKASSQGRGLEGANGVTLSQQLGRPSASVQQLPAGKGQTASLVGGPSTSAAAGGMTAASRRSGRDLEEEDEMFAPVPEQFDFDLQDYEVRALTSGGALGEGGASLPGGAVPSNSQAGASARSQGAGAASAMNHDDDDDDDAGGGAGGGYDDDDDDYMAEGDGGGKAAAARSGLDGEGGAKASTRTRSGGGSNLGDTAKFGFTRYRPVIDTKGTGIQRKDFGLQLKDTSDITCPSWMAATGERRREERSREIAGRWNIFGVQPPVPVPSSSTRDQAAGSGGGNAASTSAASCPAAAAAAAGPTSLTPGQLARQRLQMAPGLPSLEFLAWNLPHWASDELWVISVDAILGREEPPPPSTSTMLMLEEGARLAGKGGGGGGGPGEDATAGPTSSGGMGSKRPRPGEEEEGGQRAAATAGVPASSAGPPSAAVNGGDDDDDGGGGYDGGGGDDDDDDDDGYGEDPYGAWGGAIPARRSWAEDDDDDDDDERDRDSEGVSSEAGAVGGGGASSSRWWSRVGDRARAAGADLTARTKSLISHISQMSQMQQPDGFAVLSSQSGGEADGGGGEDRNGGAKRPRLEPWSLTPWGGVVLPGDKGGSGGQEGASSGKGGATSLSQGEGGATPRRVSLLLSHLLPPANPSFIPSKSGPAVSGGAALSPLGGLASPTKTTTTTTSGGGGGGMGGGGEGTSNGNVPSSQILGPVEVVQGKRRMRAAQTFYDLLVLQNRGYVRLEQPEAYEDLGVQPLAPIAARVPKIGGGGGGPSAAPALGPPPPPPAAAAAAP